MSNSKMERILVTGGAGYIGQVAVYKLLESGYQVTVLDDLSTGHLDAIDPRARFVQGSILDGESVASALEGVSAIMHFAGKSLVGESVEKPDLYFHVNRDGSKHLFDLARNAGVTKFVFSSTAATYGQPEASPITEDAPTNPTNPYGESKLAVDQYLSELAATGIGAASLRYFNVAGALPAPHAMLRERHHPETHLIPNILNSSAKLKVFGSDWPTKDGTCIRDYIHVIDLIEAHILALENLQPGQHQIINLGSGSGYSVLDVIKTASEVVGHNLDYEVTGRRAGDPAELVASTDRARKILGWRPTHSLMQMVADAAMATNI